MDDSRFPFDEKNPDAGAGQGASDAGSATGMFAATPSKPPATDDDLLAELLKPKTAAAPSVAPAAPAAAPLSADTAQKPGDVTRMLEELKALTGAVAAPSQSPAPKPTTPPVAAELKPGEFTQIFRQIPTPKRVVPQVPVPEPPAAQSPVQPPAKPSAGSAGEFTQFMQTLAGGAQEPAMAQPPRAQATPPVFSPVNPPNPVAASPAPAAGPGTPGSFTQMFQTLSPSGAPQAVPVAPVAPPSGQSSGPGSFTQIFQTLSPNAPSVPEPPQASPFPAPPSFPSFSEPLKPPPVAPSIQPPSPPSNQGGFTQLFNSLSGDGPQQPMPIASSPPLAAPSSFGTPAPLPGAPVAQPMQGGGEFTRLMRSLSDPPPAPVNGPPMAPPTAQPMPQPMPQAIPQSGPGEYTRIISGSAMREAGGGAPLPPMAPAAAPPQQAGGGFAMPPLPMKPPHLAPPAMHAPAAHPPAAAGFGMPQPFAPPAPPAASAVPQGKWQKYRPLILVVNGVLLLIVVIVLVFALRHH